MNLEIMFLEERIVLDGAAADTVIEVSDAQADAVESETQHNDHTADSSSNDAETIQADQSGEGAAEGTSDNTTEPQPEQAVNDMVDALAAPAENRNELVFVDTSVEDYQTLLQDIDPDVEVILLDGEGDALAEMLAILETKSDLDAIHIISHGGEGEIVLGSETISSDNISEHADELKAIGDSLSEDGDLLLYGCEIATGTGRNFIDSVAELTGADVAASDDKTGSAAQGGDWDLEVATGDIDTDSPLSDKAVSDFDGVLAVTDDTGMFINFAGSGIATVTDSDGTKNVTFTDSGYTYVFDGESADVTIQDGKLVVGPNETKLTIYEVNGGKFEVQKVTLTNLMDGEQDIKASFPRGASYIRMDVKGETAGRTRLMSGARDKAEFTHDIDGSKIYFNIAEIQIGDARPANYAPVLDNSGSPAFKTIEEDHGGPVQYEPKAVYVRDFVDNNESRTNNFSDADYDSPGIAITGVSDKGSLFYSVDSGRTWTELTGTVSDSSALVLATGLDIKLYFKPNKDVFGTISDAITFKAWDRTFSASGDTGVDTTTGTAFSAVKETAAIEITGVPDAPTAADKTITVTEDTAKSLSVSDFSFNDVDGDSLASVTITSLPAAGTLQLNGVDVTLNQNVSVTDISAGKLAFTPAENANGDAYSAFGFKVVDNTGLSSREHALTMKVTAVNDAPEISGTYDFGSIDEDTSSTGVKVSTLLGDEKITVSDAENDTLGVAVTGTTGNGTWEFSYDTTDGSDGNWTSFSTSETISATKALLLTESAWVRYTPDGKNAEPAATLTIRGWDQTSGDASTGTTAKYADTSTNGGSTAFSSGTASGAIAVTAVNDLPVADLNGSIDGTDSSATYAAESAGVIIAPEAVLNDVDTGDSIESMTVTLGARPNGDAAESLNLSDAAKTAADSAGLTVAYAADTGILSITGTAELAVYQTILRGVQYANSSPAVAIDTADRSITVAVNDGDGDSVARTSTVKVVTAPIIDLNGAAENRDLTVSFAEGDSNVSLADAAASIADPDGDEMNQLVIKLTNAQDGAAESITLSGRSTGDVVNGITITYNSASLITLSGAATPENYQALLRELIYNNSSENPDSTTRTVELTGRDVNNNTGVTATTSINVEALNDDPSATGLPSDVSVTEDVASNLDLSGVTLKDVDAGTGNITLKLKASAGTLAATSTSGVTVSGSGSGEMTLTGTLAAVDGFLNTASNIKYTGALNVNGNDAATLTVKMNDGGNTGTGGGTDVTLGTVNIDIAAVNDAPVLDSSKSPELTGITEDLGAPNNGSADNSTAVSALIDSAGALSNFTDVEGADAGVAIVGVKSGTLYYSTDGGANWTELSGTVSENSALILDSAAATLIYFKPDADVAGNLSDAITFKAWDGTASSSGSTGVDTTAGTAYSTATDTASISITNVNDVSVVDLNGDAAGNDGTANFAAEGSAVSIAAAGATLTDVDPGEQLASLTVTLGARPDGDAVEGLSLSDAAKTAATNAGLTVNYTADTGVLTISGAAEASVYQTILRGVQYSNSSAAAEIDKTDRTITVVANDGEGDSVARTSTVKVVTAPIVDLNGDGEGKNNTASFTEGGANVALAADATITEPDGEKISSMTIRLTNAKDGDAESIKLDGWSGGVIGPVTISYDSATQITISGLENAEQYRDFLRDLVYNNSSENPDSTTRTVEIVATDASGNASSASTISINMEAVNDDPFATGFPTDDISAAEDTAANVDLSGITLKDVDAGTGNISLKIKASAGTLAAASKDNVTVTGSGNGELILTGTLANVDAFLNTASNIKYTGAKNAVGNDVATLTVKINDGGNTGTGGGEDVTLGTLKVDITDAPDKPTATNSDQTKTYTDGDKSVALDDIVVTDPDADEEITATLTLGDIEHGSLSTTQDGNETYDADTGVWTITGTVEEVNAALAAVVFKPASELTEDVSIAVSIGDGDEHGEGAHTGTIALTYQAPAPTPGPGSGDDDTPSVDPKPTPPTPEPQPEVDGEDSSKPDLEPIPEQVRNNSSGDNTPVAESDSADSIESGFDSGGDFGDSADESGPEISVDSASSGSGADGQGPGAADADLNQVINALGGGTLSGDMGGGPGAADADLNQVLLVLESVGSSLDSGFGGQADPLGVDTGSLLAQADNGPDADAGPAAENGPDVDRGPAVEAAPVQIQSPGAVAPVAQGAAEPAQNSDSGRGAVAEAPVFDAPSVDSQSLQSSLSALNNAVAGLSFSSSTPDFTLVSLEQAVDTLAQLAGEVRQSADPAAGETLSAMTEQLTEICEKCAENGQDVGQLLQKLSDAKAMLSN